MSKRMLLAVACAATLIVAACGGGAATGAPAASQPATSEAPAASESAAGGAACAPSTDAGTVQAAIANFAFDPATIDASVGDVVAWTNNDSTAHTATVQSDPTCTTENLAAGTTGAIVFNTAGSYAFFCKIHPNMTGTVEVS